MTDGTDIEVIAWLDDHSRYLLHLTAHPRITARIVAQTFHAAAAGHGYPASTLTDNGMVYTVRLAGAKNAGGRTSWSTTCTDSASPRRTANRTIPPLKARSNDSGKP